MVAHAGHIKTPKRTGVSSWRESNGAALPPEEKGEQEGKESHTVE